MKRDSLRSGFLLDVEGGRKPDEQTVSVRLGTVPDEQGSVDETSDVTKRISGSARPVRDPSGVSLVDTLLDIQRAGRMVTRHLNSRLRCLAMTSGQYQFLAAIDVADPPLMGTVAQFLGMDRTTLTANLKPMERCGMILVEADENDRRARRLYLTHSGRRTLAKARPIWKQAEAEMLAGFGLSNARELRITLTTLIEALNNSARP